MIDQTLLKILVCPADRGPLLLVQQPDGEVLYNPRLRRVYRFDDGIPVLLVDEAIQVSDDDHERLMARAQSADPQ
ncbi:MAG TPA: Trm112 family protein [Mycobacterium sp.]|nr:Trm112 family protein [Mycobacterium sp.]